MDLRPRRLTEHALNLVARYPADFASAGLVLAGFAALRVASDVGAPAFVIGWSVSTLGLLVLASSSAERIVAARRLARRRRLGDRGMISAELVLNLPVFMLMVSMIVQMALIGVAAVVMQHAAFTAARAATVQLSADPPRPDQVHRAAAAVLAAISPPARAGTGRSPFALRLGRLMASQPAPFRDRSMAQRVAFALEATTVSTTPTEVDGKPEDVVVVVEYRLPLIAPPAALAFATDRRPVAGVRGPFLTMKFTTRLRSTGSRSRFF